MPKSLNVAMIIGNLTRDPEMRYTPNGKAVTSFGVATNREWTDSTGSKKDEAEFHNVVAWAKLGEICNQYLKKGTKVYVQGRIQTHTWDDQQGQKHYRTEIIADEMIILSGRADGASSTASSTGQPEAPASPEPVKESNKPTGAEDVVIDEKTGMPF
jgi:single-strand DNA-binding protein